MAISQDQAASEAPSVSAVASELRSTDIPGAIRAAAARRNPGIRPLRPSAILLRMTSAATATPRATTPVPSTHGCAGAKQVAQRASAANTTTSSNFSTTAIAIAADFPIPAQLSSM